MTTENEIRASLLLSRMPGLTQPQARALLQYYGTAEAAFADEAPASELWARVRREATELNSPIDRIDAELAFCAVHHIRVIPLSSDEYPRLLRAETVSDPPLNLFYRGTGTLDRRHILSIVGTRHITDYGKEIIENLLADLARLLPDVLIVSGLAYGVDIHAHRAALAGNLDTIAVLAHGLDRIYPILHRDTAEQMTQHGGLLTEYFTHTVPDKGNFVRRNRIVAGLSAATLVIESADKGGALITANLAASYGREVMAYPGRITDRYSAGCNQLIRDNKATLVTSAADILSLLRWKAQSAEAPRYKQMELFPLLTPEQQTIVDALTDVDSLSVDNLSLQTHFSVSQLTDLLFDLEDLNLVKLLPGNRYRLAKR